MKKYNLIYGIIFLSCICSIQLIQGQNSVPDYNIKKFGAAGDGKTDDTDAIQKAVNSGTGIVYLPKGVFRITRPIVIELDKFGYTSIKGDGGAQILMAGSGPAIRFVGTHFKSADPADFSQNVWDRQRMPLLDGVTIYGNHPEAVGVEAVGTMELTISRIFIRGVLHGIHLVGNNRNIIISDCHIYENRGIGIYYDNVNLHQSNITGCHISYNNGGGIVSRAGNVRNIQITGCDIEGNMNPAMPPTANVLIDRSGGHLGTGEVAITGCTIQHDYSSPGSANIRINGNYNSGSNPKDDDYNNNITITGNIISDVIVNIHLEDCRDVTITGNTFRRGHDLNLLIEKCSNIIVGENTFGGLKDRIVPEFKNGLKIIDSEGCIFTGLLISNTGSEPAAFTFENCRRMNISNCSILDCDNIGLLLKDVSNSYVSGCLIRDDRPGFQSIPFKMTGGKENQVDRAIK
jgi:hypothetical protein